MAEIAPVSFADAAALDAWLATHHQTASEIWVRIFKAGSGQPSVTWTDCVIESLRYGWIDGQKRSWDAESYIQRLTPRRARSGWSARNCDHVERLIAAGRMTPTGMAQVAAAQADGRWDMSYAGQADMVIPADFLAALDELPEAKAFYLTLDRKNLFPIYYRLQTAKRPETRARRMTQILAQLARGERFH